MPNKRVNSRRHIIGWVSVLFVMGVVVILMSYLGLENLAFDMTTFGTGVTIISVSVAGVAVWIAMKSDEQMTALANLKFDEKVVAMQDYRGEFSQPMLFNKASDFEQEYRKFLWDLRAMTHVAKWADKKKRLEARQLLDRITDSIAELIQQKSWGSNWLDKAKAEVNMLCDRIWSHGRQEMGEKDELKKGFIVPRVTAFFDVVRRISLVRGEKWSAAAIEAYVLCWLGGEVVLLGLLFAWPSWSNNWGFFITAPVILSYRVLDILRAGFDWLMIAPYRGLQIISTPRLLVLSLVNYVELALIFGVLAFLARSGFYPQFQSAWHSFYYSVSVITTLGTTIEPLSVQSRVLFLSEIGLSLIFLLLIIARAVSLLPHPKG